MAPDRYAVVGHPVAHSLSPRIHALFARACGQHIRYDTLDLAPESFETGVRAFFTDGGRGLNITLPHKPAAARLASELSEAARLAGAVNTLLPLAAGLRGENTDGTGLLRDLARLGVSLTARRVLLVGAGGAARGVLAPLLAEKPAACIIANRTSAHAQSLAAQFAGLGPVRAVALDALTGPFDVILNATAASLHGEVIGLAPHCLDAHTQCYDLAYGAEHTPFQRWALAHGAAAAHDGLGMLVEQAAEAFWLWRGVRPDTAPVLQALRAR